MNYQTATTLQMQIRQALRYVERMEPKAADMRNRHLALIALRSADLMAGGERSQRKPREAR